MREMTLYGLTDDVRTDEPSPWPLWKAFIAPKKRPTDLCLNLVQEVSALLKQSDRG